MKNQYFGDINDYRKYGLLRALQSNGKSSLLVSWMLTHDDGSQDGQLRTYLKQPAKWRQYDPDLFDGIAGLLPSAAIPKVSLLEGSGLLLRTSYHSTIVPDTRPDRDAWREGLLAAARTADLVFVDPDNGIETSSKPIGRKGSSKYVAWEELRSLWELGCSLLIYQHFRREPYASFAKRIMSELRKRIDAGFTEGFCTSHVLFLLAAQERHEWIVRDASTILQQNWSNQIKPMGLAIKPLQPTGSS